MKGQTEVWATSPAAGSGWVRVMVIGTDGKVAKAILAYAHLIGTRPDSTGLAALEDSQWFDLVRR